MLASIWTVCDRPRPRRWRKLRDCRFLQPLVDLPEHLALLDVVTFSHGEREQVRRSPLELTLTVCALAGDRRH